MKKLVAVTTTSTLEPSISKKVEIELKELDWVFYIYYPLLFQNNIRKVEIMTFINSKSKVNMINPAYAAKQGHLIHKFNVDVQSINGSSMQTYGIVIIIF